MAALSRSEAPATPTHVSPLEFLTTALPASSPARTSPEPVASSATPATRPTSISPAPLLTDSFSACSIRTWPMPFLTQQSPSGPSHVKSAIAPVARTLEPAGSSITTSIDPPLERLIQLRVAAR